MSNASGTAVLRVDDRDLTLTGGARNSLVVRGGGPIDGTFTRQADSSRWLRAGVALAQKVKWAEGKSNAAAIMAPMKVLVATSSGVIDSPLSDADLLWKGLDLERGDFDGKWFAADDYRLTDVNRGSANVRATWSVTVRSSKAGGPPGTYVLHHDGNSEGPDIPDMPPHVEWVPSPSRPLSAGQMKTRDAQNLRKLAEAYMAGQATARAKRTPRSSGRLFWLALCVGDGPGAGNLEIQGENDPDQYLTPAAFVEIAISPADHDAK
ncbi:MAG: hypothetical protein AB7S36_20315, partial [Planctomycetota bacterium]